MAAPYYTDDQVTLHCGDALEVLRTLPGESASCVVTSPPYYYNLRDYGQPGQYGLEPTPAAYVETMRAVFSEVRRVLTADGTLWLNLGDSYDGKKNLLGVPWRVAFALQDDGWILRSDVTWHKPNAMPESVNDRPSGSSERLFLFAKSPRYFFDLDAISGATACRTRKRWSETTRVRSGHGWRREPCVPRPQRLRGYPAWPHWRSKERRTRPASRRRQPEGPQPGRRLVRPHNPVPGSSLRNHAPGPSGAVHPRWLPPRWHRS